MAGRGAGGSEGPSLSYDELFEHLLSAYASISLDDLYDETPNLGHPLGVTNPRILMLMAQGQRRSQKARQDAAYAAQVGMSSEDPKKVFPVAADPSLQAPKSTEYETEEWWK